MMLIVLLHASCGDDSTTPTTVNPTSDEAPEYEDTSVREIASTRYPYVANVTTDLGRCSGTLLKHGLFITAKHCFRDQDTVPADFTGMSIVFSESGEASAEDNLVIADDQITQVIYDGDTTDIAYLLYEASLTNSISYLSAFPTDYIQEDLSEETEIAVELVGFPSQTGTLKRLITKDCIYTGYQAENKVFPNQVTYDGITYDSNCWAWFGNSGGPVYEVDENNSPIRLLGIVSHTFDVDEDGNIPSDARGNDDFGTFVRTSNFSPMSQTLQLEQLL